MRFVVGLIVIFGGIGLMLQDAPGVLFDFQHVDEFVPAQDLKVTSAKCTNWNVAMFDHCTVAFESKTGARSGQLDDWKFGRASTDPIHLLEWQGDSSVVTTDVSLETVRNRLGFVVTAALTGLFFLAGVAVKVTRVAGRRR